jgi:chromosome segregation ATPase
LSDTLQISTCNPVNPPRCAIPTAQQESVSAMELISEQSVPNSTGIIDGENATTQMQEIYETINILADGIQVLNDDAQRHSVDLIQLQSAIESSEQNLSLLQISIQEANAFLTGIQINQNILQQEVESLKQTIDDMQHVSYNGTSVWKITNVLKKMSKFHLKYSY